MGAAVEASAEDDDIRPLGDLLGELDRGLCDLGAGVGKEKSVDRSRRQFGQLGRQRLEQIVLVDVDLGVNEPFGLSRDGRGDLRVGVTGGVDGNAGGKVEVLFAIGRGDPTAMSPATLSGVTENQTLERCDACVMPSMLRLSAPVVERVCAGQVGLSGTSGPR